MNEIATGLAFWLWGANLFTPTPWEFCLILFTLVWGLTPTLVYEVGVRHGNSTRAILNGLRKSGGRLFSCDIQDCNGAVLDPHLRSRWKFYHMPSSEFAAQLTELADMVCIDGDHGFGAVCSDIVALWPLLRPGGVMVFDDTTSQPAGPGRAIDLLRRGGIEALSLSAFANGFGIIQKRAGDPGDLGSILLEGRA